MFSQPTSTIHESQKYASGKIKEGPYRWFPTARQVIFSYFLFQAIRFLLCHSKSIGQSSIQIHCLWQLPLSTVDSQTFRNFVLTAELRFVIPRLFTIRNSLTPIVSQQMEETMRRVYLTTANFVGIAVHFIDAEWKLYIFVLVADSFLDKHTACNMNKSWQY